MWREGFVSGGRTRFFVRMLGQSAWRDADVDAGDEHDHPQARDDLVVLLHGWPEDGSSWRHVAPLLRDAGYRVAAPDLKGFGRSDHPHHGYDAETLADEISSLVRNLHARRAVLVGHDWGGAIALATAFRHPGRVRALVVASAPFRQLDLTASWHIPLLNLPLAPELAFATLARPLVARAIRYASVVHTPFDEEVIDTYTDAISVDPRAWLSYYRGLPRRALVDWAVRRVRRRAGFLRAPNLPHHLRVPAAVVWGERDRATPHHLAVRVAHDLDATLTTLAGVGHFVHEEDPRGMAEAVLELVGPAPAGVRAAGEHDADSRRAQRG